MARSDEASLGETGSVAWAVAVGGASGVSRTCEGVTWIALAAPKENAPRNEPEGVYWRSVARKAQPELLDRLAGNVRDVATADAKVRQFAVGHAAEFVAGLTILAPIVERACEVHDPILSRVVCQRLISLAGRHLMLWNIIVLSRSYRDNAASHPCRPCKPLRDGAFAAGV